jgi:hypothetical protein|tara:strand:+ start:3268 stop:3453 length:186 start_codon:yes stop_codon:yes gene_type:complete
MKKKSSIIINKIKSIRSKNNENWMDLLKLAFKHNPEDSKRILKRIVEQDKKVTQLVKKLSK